MRHRSALLVFFSLFSLLLVPPAQAQEADTTAVETMETDTTRADTLATDTTVADTAQTPQADTTTADTTTADTSPPPDTVQAAAADSLAADSLAADTVQSADRKPGEAKERARAAATSWLSLTDAGKFGESWDIAAPTLQNGISRATWIERATQSRSQLDSLKSRELERVQYRDSTTQMPTEAPVVTLQYRSEFDADSVLEALVATKQEGEWKVAGYRIVPVPETRTGSDSTAIEADSTATDADSTATEAESTSQR